MTDTEANPFLGRTLRVLRPSARNSAWREKSPEELHAAQTQWDAAEADRRRQIAAAAAKEASLLEWATTEEPARKALENRLRIAYLATKGATLQAWFEQRERILAEARATGESPP
jgi:hypothetical protein